MGNSHAAERHRRQNGAFRAGVEEGRRRERDAQSISLGALTHTPDFMMGDHVRKVGGRYGGPGRVVGISEDLDGDGYRLYQVAMRVEGGCGEFIHVFPAACLRLVVNAAGIATPPAEAPTNGDTFVDIEIGGSTLEASRAICTVALTAWELRRLSLHASANANADDEPRGGLDERQKAVKTSWRALAKKLSDAGGHHG